MIISNGEYATIIFSNHFYPCAECTFGKEALYSSKKEEGS